MAPAVDERPLIELIDVTRHFISPTGASYTALRNFNLSVAPGEFVAVVGPTGCGKSTTLNLITGLAKPSGGDVRVMGETVTGTDKRIGFVFQTDALFPWRNVLRNVAAGPLFRGMAKTTAYELARSWIARVGLNGFENHYPHQLSGGMRKRVTLAQTFINNPTILLMDEPFSSLDAQTRIVMQDELWRYGRPRMHRSSSSHTISKKQSRLPTVSTSSPLDRQPSNPSTTFICRVRA